MTRGHIVKPKDRLQPCRVCGHECYTWANPCPECGVDWPTHTAWGINWFVVIGGILMFCAVAAAFFG